MATAAVETQGSSHEGGIGLAEAGLGRRRFAFGLLACVAISAVLGGATLGREPLSHDELETLAHVTQPFDLYLDELPSRQNGVLFDLSLAVVVRLGGQSEVWLRLLPLLALLASVALVGVVGARLANRSIGLGAALLLAVHPFSLVYSQNARPYAFALFFSILSVLLLDRALERPRIGRWAAYVAAVAATWYSHDIAILALATHPVLVYFRGRAHMRSYMLAFLAIVAVGVPLVALGTLDGPGLESALSWLPHPWPRKAGNTVYWLGGTWIGLAVSFAILTAGSLRFWSLRKAGRAPVSTGTAAFVASWLVVPATFAFFISYWQPILEPRYVLSSAAAACLALSIALATFARHWRVVGMCVLVAAFVAASVRTMVLMPELDWRAVGTYLDENARPDERVVTTGEKWLTTVALEYYARTLGGDRRHLTLEPTEARTPDRIIIDRGKNEGRLTAEARSGRGIWVVAWGLNYDDTPAGPPAEFAGCTVEQPLPPIEAVYVYYVSNCPA